MSQGILFRMSPGVRWAWEGWESGDGGNRGVEISRITMEYDTLVELVLIMKSMGYDSGLSPSASYPHTRQLFVKLILYSDFIDPLTRETDSNYGSFHHSIPSTAMETVPTRALFFSPHV